MNNLSLLFAGTTVGILAFGTSSTTVYENYVKDQTPDNANTIDLGTAANFAILSEWGVSNTGDTTVTGHVGVSPGEETAVRGFNLKSAYLGTSSKSPLVLGRVYAASYKTPTPTKLTRAIIDMLNAYADSLGKAAGVVDLSNGNIGGKKLPPGVYKWNSDLIINSDITLDGEAQDVWIFQIAQNLNVSSGTKVILSNGAQAKNIFWQVAGETTIGTNSKFNGTIICQTNITLQRYAVLYGRAFAQSRISLDSNTIKIAD